MPSASTAKLEKQASSEAVDPVNKGIVLVEHKIRNLLKKKTRLDGYREKQKNGITLDSEQKSALLKYEETCQNLIFAQELRKQFDGILVDAEKARKKKEKKEAYEREQQEVSKVKEILIIQDVLASMGTDSVREDFLAGRNKAVKLTETELQYLDDLFVEVLPKREPEEGQPNTVPFMEQAQNAAKHLLNIVEGKDKEVVGTKCSIIKELIDKISNCGYFDHTADEGTVPPLQETEVPVIEQPTVPEPVEPEPEEVAAETVPSATFQPSSAAPVMEPVVETAGLYISQRPMADVLTNVMGGGPTTFNFIQESELEPEVAVVPVTALPIPTQTFTNANFAPPSGAAHQAPPAEVMYAAPAQYSPVPPPQPQPPLQPAAAPAAMPVPTQQFDNSATFQTTKPQSGGGDWEDTTEQNDWAMQVEQSEQNRWNEPSQQSDDWADNSNDGFQPATRVVGRGGRGRGGGSDRGRGGPRGGRGGGYQNGRGNYGNSQNNRGGNNYYRNNDGGNNYYQNGYQSRGDGERGDRGERSYRGGGERRGGPRGGQQDRGGSRGAPRGSGGRGGNPRGGSRGGNRQ